MKGLHICRIEYVEKALDAERRLKRGERQLLCPECRLWLWNDERCPHGAAIRITEKDFDRRSRRQPTLPLTAG